MAGAFDPWNTYHESPVQQAAIKERAKFRDAMKEEYRKIRFNPFKPPVGAIVSKSFTHTFRLLALQQKALLL